MPIANENVKVSVDFPYEWDNPVEGTRETYQIRFIHNDYGPVLQISQGPYEPIELPAIMFLEVAEYLVRNNYLKGMPNISQSKQGSGALPMPSIGRKPKIGNTPPPAPQRRGIGLGSFQAPEPEAEGDTTGLVLKEQQSQEDTGAAQIAAATVEAKTPAPISPEEAQKILQARLAAKAKANTAGKQIRKNPKYEGGEQE